MMLERKPPPMKHVSFVFEPIIESLLQNVSLENLGKENTAVNSLGLRCYTVTAISEVCDGTLLLVILAIYKT